ncbi:MAG: hypothetical protein RL701_4506 [Pseudomonadota bacterium]
MRKWMQPRARRGLVALLASLSLALSACENNLAPLSTTQTVTNSGGSFAAPASTSASATPVDVPGTSSAGNASGSAGVVAAAGAPSAGFGTATAATEGTSSAGAAAPPLVSTSGNLPTAGAPAAVGGDVNPPAEPTYPWPSDCEQKYKFVAHGQQVPGDTTPYAVPAQQQYYASFYFKAPWGVNPVHGLRFRSLVSNPKIVHHWILYGVNSSSKQDGTSRGAPGQFPASLSGEAFIAGWAPGAPDIELPEGVGLYMPAGEKATFRLEVHYNNTVGAQTEADTSGVEFCTTSKKRAQEAATHWLGSVWINVPAHTRKEVAATCSPYVTDGPVHIMSMQPHMHQTGVHAKAVVKRADGKLETLFDQPYSFDDQRAVDMPPKGAPDEVLIRAGDSITTTCTFDNQTNQTITFGENTENEMCFFFTLAWPRGQLASNPFAFKLPIPGAEPAVNCL